jgi:teichuronic acid biosynthesis glycosyltransferase TuaH
MENKKIIIFSSVEWDINWQIHHEIATRLSKNNDVLYVENLGSRTFAIKDLNRIFPRILKWIKSKSGFIKINKSLYTYTPLFIPVHYSRIFISLNKNIILNNIYKWIDFKKANNQNIIIISFLPIPLIKNIIEKINPIVSVYYCADNMSSHNYMISKFNENKFIKLVDHVFYTSEKLKSKIKKNPSNYLLPSGVNFERFNTKFKKKKINKKNIIFGFVGSVRNIIDLELIYKAAKILKNCKFVIVGPIFVDVNKFKKLSNVKFIGYVSHKEIPKYINNFNIGLIPYIKNNFTKTIYPVKLNEYLAMGKPVFSTRIPEMVKLSKEIKNAIYFVDKPIDFKKNLKLFLLKKTSNKNLINFAKKNSWSLKFKIFINIINKILINKLQKNNEKSNIKNNFLFYIKTKKFSFYKFLFFITIIYLAVTSTPLFWYLGENLIIRGDYKKADAVVVFSGDGNNSYINNSYQLRVLDILPLIKKNYVNKIILSSGREQTFSEEQLIKSLLVSNGVKEDQLILVERYPKTTYENILFVKEKLDELKIDNFMFITAPYHTKRATLIWEKNFPNLKIYNITPIDAQSQIPVWSNDMKNIEVILYEYASILYNKILKRL